MKALEKTKYPFIFRADNGKFYLRIKRGSRPELFRSLKTDKITDARLIGDKLVQNYLGLKKQTGRVLVGDLWQEFVTMYQTRSRGTYASIEIQGRVHLMPFFSSMLLEEVSEKDWEKYIVHSFLNTPGRKLFNDRKYFAMLFVYAHKLGLVARVPEFRNPDPPIDVGRAFSDDEISRLLENADQDLEIKILMAYTMGMRRGEVIGLSWDRVDLTKKVITLRAEDTKIRKGRKFGISNAVLKCLAARRRDSDGSPWVFPSLSDKNRRQLEFRKIWTTCKKVSNVKGRFHDLRHTFLTKAFKTSNNPALICHYAGLSLDEAQKTYLHFTVEDTRQIANAIEVPT